MSNHRAWRPIVLVVAAIAALVACGPSSGQVRAARSARYSAEPGVVFEGVRDAVASLHRVTESDPLAGVMITEEKWYEVDGTSASRDANDNWLLGEGAVMLALQVAIKGEPGAWYVEVTPFVLQHQSGSPRPRQLAPDDPQMPGWVQGKIDNVYLAVHEHLKPHVVPTAP